MRGFFCWKREIWGIFKLIIQQAITLCCKNNLSKINNEKKTKFETQGGVKTNNDNLIGIPIVQ